MVFPVSTVIEVKLVQFLKGLLKALSPMRITPLPIITDVRFEQVTNALFPMLVTLLGIIIEVKPIQFANALFPMLVTLLGMLVSLQPRIKLFPDFVMIALQLLRESYMVFPEATVIVDKLLQSEKASMSIFVNPLPILRDVTAVHPEKASSPMLVTLLGMVMEVIL